VVRRESAVLGQRRALPELHGPDRSARPARTIDVRWELVVERRLYGVPADSLGATGPAVVSLNGVVASLAVMEWMVWTTGLRSPAPLLEYRGSAGAVFVNKDQPREDCYYRGLARAA
jgi:hypothetical protein